MARKQRAEQWTEYRRQREEEEWQWRVKLIAEFDAGDPVRQPYTPLPDEILKYHRAVRRPRAI